jgi:hypothetical protein
MDKIEQIREAIARLTQLSAEELASTKALIAEAAKDVDVDGDNSPESVATLTELADFLDNIEAQETALAQAAAEAEQAKNAARERIAKINGKTEDPENPEGEGEGEGETEEVAEGENAETPELVTASGKRLNSISKMALKGKKVTGSPELTNQSRTSLVAGAGSLGRSQGEVFENRYDLAETMCKTLSRMPRNSAPRGNTLIASAEWIDQYPDERRLESGPDQFISTADAMKMDAITHPQSLLATGGICAPVNIDWSLGTWAVADRPIRDGLPAFQSTRGGLQYRTPPDISDLLSATAIWTEATDADPMGATKPVLQISCPDTTTVYVAAVSTRLQFGNMQSRFDPETVAANTDLAIAAAAQTAELNLWSLIQADCVSVTSAQLLGGTRDFLATLDQTRAAYRDLHRLGDGQVLTAILPRWVKDLMRADRVRELAHDGQSVDPLAIPDDYIEGLFSMRNVKPIFTLDGLPEPEGDAYPAQTFGAFTNTDPVPAFPQTMLWNLFVEGSFQFLDGGRLDLGVVRDSTLDATNDYETFVETFEGIADRGFASSAIQILTTLCPFGGSAGSVDAHTLCA